MRGDEPVNEIPGPGFRVETTPGVDAPRPAMLYRLPYPPPFRGTGQARPEPPVLKPDPVAPPFIAPGYTGPVRYSEADGPDLAGFPVTPPYQTPRPSLAGFPVVLLNGPPRSGKDTAANGLLMENPGAVLMRFSAPLKAATHALFGLRDITADHYEDCKDTPSADFMGLTPRQAYIAVSEQAVKRTFGTAFFGRVMVERLRRVRGAPSPARVSHWPTMAVCPDSGFSIETAPVTREVGAANVILIRVHRPGFDFAQDSRSYISLEHVHTVDVHNTGTVADLQRAVCDAVTKWLTLPT